jgi:hypothetical protein
LSHGGGARFFFEEKGLVLIDWFALCPPPRFPPLSNAENSLFRVSSSGDADGRRARSLLPVRRSAAAIEALLAKLRRRRNSSNGD